MSSAMYAGVSGLKAQQERLNVVGNNIANINTSGYKSQRVTFSDLLSQTITAATAPSSASNRGGTNPQQVGLGVNVASIDTDMSTGSMESTGNSRDVAIGGDGFFIVKGGSTGNYQFTRAGNFGADTNGNLTVNGLKVCGWQQYAKQADGTYKYDTQKALEPINLFSDSYNGNKRIIAPKATTTATLSGTVDPTKTAKGTGMKNIGTIPTTADSTTTMTVYDSQGNSYDVQVKMYKCYTDKNTNGTATGSVALTGSALTVNGTANTLNIAVDGGTGVNVSVAAGTYSTSSDLLSAVNTAINATSLNGKVTASLDSSNHLVFMSASTGSSSAVTVTAGSSNDGLSALVGTPTSTNGTTGSGNTSWFWQAVPSSTNITVSTPSSGYIEFDSTGKLVSTDQTNFPTNPSITLNPTSAVGAAPFPVTLNMEGLSSYTTTSNTAAVSAAADGYAAGELQDFSIGSDGIITGSYSNGQKQPLAMIALTTFTNPGGLEKIGSNLYASTVNSGSFTGGVQAGTGGTATLSSGNLEGSNVDLAQQFSDMMVTERAYQANSKIITTSDTMMETVINMIR